MKIVNLTPHTVIVHKNESFLTYPPFGKTVRLDSEPQFGIYFGSDVDVVSAPTFKSEIQWPDIPNDVDAVLVSMPVGQQIQNSAIRYPFHVMGPDTGPESVVRNAEGQITGVKRFVLYAERKSPPY